MSATPTPIRFDGRVAIVTGAGGGLGRSHALQLAARGAKVLVNDLSAAEQVVAEIRAAGGEAIANAGSVTDPQAVQAMVDQAMVTWGRVDVLVNNAGFLRDKSFSKMTLDDVRQVVDVHLMAAFYGAKAVWDIMKAQGYGRIVFTTSSSGLFGNFGQANYGAAKMGLVGLMQTLALEGEKYNVRANCLAPTAATRMTQDLMPPEVLALLTPESLPCCCWPASTHPTAWCSTRARAWWRRPTWRSPRACTWAPGPMPPSRCCSVWPTSPRARATACPPAALARPSRKCAPCWPHGRDGDAQADPPQGPASLNMGEPWIAGKAR